MMTEKKVLTIVCTNPTFSKISHNQDPARTFDGVFPGPSELNGTRSISFSNSNNDLNILIAP